MLPPAISRSSGTLLVLLAFALPGMASGAILTFVDRAAWEAALGAPPDFTETFDAFTADTPFRLAPIDFGAFSLTQIPARDDLFSFHNSVQVAPFAGGVSSDHGFTTPNLSLFLEGDSSLHLRMSFLDPIDAWGADDYVSTVFGVPQMLIGFEDGSQTAIALPGTADGRSFFGIVADAGEKIRDFNFVGPSDGNFASGNRFILDDVSGRLAPIPEPVGSSLLGAGLAVLTSWRRCASRSARPARDSIRR